MKVVFTQDGLQLPPKCGTWRIYTDAESVRRTADAARAAGCGFRIRIRVRYVDGWVLVKNLWRN